MVQAVCVVPGQVGSVRRVWDSGDGSMGVEGAQCSRATSSAAWWMCVEGRRLVVRRGQQAACASGTVGDDEGGVGAGCCDDADCRQLISC